jgi:outer membrane protein OmpA-like peptidoglycan-associated protein
LRRRFSSRAKSLAQDYEHNSRKDKFMKQNRKRMVASTALLCFLCAGLALGASDGKKVKVNGLITGRDGENVMLRSTKDSSNIVVVLTDDTKVQQPKGLLKLRHAEHSVTALIPGLKIEVEGTGTDARVVAKTISFDKDDLQLAETIQAGLAPTQEQQATNTANIAENKAGVEANKAGVAANQQQGAKNAAGVAANQQQIAANQQDIQATTQRFSELSEYDTKAKATVYFGSGSTKISESDQSALALLAQGAVGLTGYLIQVKGYADSSGNAAMNQDLSMDRAQAVVAYLQQNCHIPIRHIVAPGAMGESDPAAPNETAEGRAENRRVDVKVIVNKGVAGGM